jgi:hypothetical protein
MSSAADPIWDQTLAAFDEAARKTKAAGGCAVELTPITGRVAERWLRGGPFAHGKLCDSKDHEWTYCDPEHLAEPQLCLGIGNRPGHVMCADCCVRAVADDESFAECNWCGTVTRSLYFSTHPIGPAVVIFCFCENHVAEPDSTMLSDEWQQRLSDTLRTQSFLPARRYRPTE